MFCLTEESLANHMGERRLREDEKELELKTTEIAATIPTAEDEEISVVQVGEVQLQKQPS
jgi:Asp-tRNA(Asn)/Glu-tRNA(Gln) amidotransferase C subunit